jgi:hypothetical protein
MLAFLSTDIAQVPAAKAWMQKTTDIDGLTLVSVEEIAALNALVTEVARRTGRSEFGVERDLANQFAVPNIKFLPTYKYDRALQFLVDQI